MFPYLENLLIAIIAKPYSSQIELSFQSNACKMNGGYPHSRLFVSQQYNQHSQSQHSLFGTHSFPFSALATSEDLSHHSYLNTLTSHSEYTILVDAIISQSKGLSITSEQPKNHLDKVWEVYGSFHECVNHWKSTQCSPQRSTPLPLRFAQEHSSLCHNPLSIHSLSILSS